MPNAKAPRLFRHTDAFACLLPGTKQVRNHPCVDALPKRLSSRAALRAGARGPAGAPRLRRGRTRQGRPRNLGPTPHRSRPHGIRGTPRPGRGQGNSPNSSSARASPRTSSDAAHLRSSTSVARLVGRSRSHPFGCLRIVDIRHSCTDSRESELAVRSLDPGSVLVRRRSKKDLGRKSRPASGASLVQPAD